MNTQAERSRDKRALNKYEPQDVILDDSQHDEMCQVMSALENGGRSELDGVFAEADAHGVGTNIRKVWENDKRDLKKQFQSDQLTQGTNSFITLFCTAACNSLLQKPGDEVTGGAPSPYV